MAHQHPHAQPELIDLSRAVVFCPPELSRRERKAVDMLLDEVEKRTRLRWACVDRWPEAPVLPVIAVGRSASFGGRLAPEEHTSIAEGYRLRVQPPIVFVIGDDERGVLFGVGRLLRCLRLRPDVAGLPADLQITSAPRYPLRGHQLGYRDKTNSYDGWDLPQWEQYIRDLAVFGANAIELIPPRSDDKPDSVHFPRPPLEMMAGVSRLADDYGLDVWIWYPAMDRDYADPATVDFALREWGAVFRALPRVDAVFVPGGDPGHTRPSVMMPMLTRQAENLRRLHPRAQWWMSPQGYSREWMEEFLQILRQEPPAWLAGLVHGPWMYLTTADFRTMIPARYPIRNYPDITHSLNCQYPVPGWDVAYTVTEGREPVNPRPLDQAAIFHASMPSTDGFLAYSEGCQDDVNKAVWSALGWNPAADLAEVLRDYSRYFISESLAEDFAEGLFALERNWRGRLAENDSVDATLRHFQSMEAAASPADLKNWRFQQALYRAYYDAYVREHLRYETALEEQAMERLRQAPVLGALPAIDEAERILEQAETQPVARDLRTRVFQLAEALFQSIHMQLSVPLYRAQEEVRGANLDGIDFPLNNHPWLAAHFAEIRRQPDEHDRLQAIQAIVEWTNPGPGGVYVNLCSSDITYLVDGRPYEQDPAFLCTPLLRYPYRKDPRPLRLAWHGGTGSAGNAPFRLRFGRLDLASRYRLRVVYFYFVGQPEYEGRLLANDSIEIHPAGIRAGGPMPLEFDIPATATRDGTLLLTWQHDPDIGGTPVSEIWLIKA